MKVKGAARNRCGRLSISLHGFGYTISVAGLIVTYIVTCRMYYCSMSLRTDSNSVVCFWVYAWP